MGIAVSEELAGDVWVAAGEERVGEGGREEPVFPGLEVGTEPVVTAVVGSGLLGAGGEGVVTAGAEGARTVPREGVTTVPVGVEAEGSGAGGPVPVTGPGEAAEPVLGGGAGVRV